MNYRVFVDKPNMKVMLVALIIFAFFSDSKASVPKLSVIAFGYMTVVIYDIQRHGSHNLTGESCKDIHSL